jgi:phosphoribosylformimino-5-aminoimidazole carboxamide ribotide isomerase
MHIFPAVDIKGGKAVRLYKGQADKETVYNESPLAAAERWLEEGATWLHVVDLDAAFEGTSENESHILEIARASGVPVQVGGGIRNVEKVRRLIGGGVERIVVGTKVVEDRGFLDEILAEFAGHVAVGIDAKDGMVAVKGWVETSEVKAEDLMKDLSGSGVSAIVYTDISRDGALAGANVKAMRRATEITDVPIVASGGVTIMDDVLALCQLPLQGIIIGKALYDNRIDLAEAVKLVRDAG